MKSCKKIIETCAGSDNLPMTAAENLEKELQIAQKEIFELKNQCKTDFDRLVSQEELIQ